MPALGGGLAAPDTGYEVTISFEKGLGKLVERVAHATVGLPIRGVCLRGVRSMRLHDSIPSIDCDGNQVKPVIEARRNLLVLFHRVTWGAAERANR
jgi:hypothetical protein